MLTVFAVLLVCHSFCTFSSAGDCAVGWVSFVVDGFVVVGAVVVGFVVVVCEAEPEPLTT